MFLNSGVFGNRIAPLSNVSIPEINEIMSINFWSHKFLLDSLLHHGCNIKNIVVSSSVAGVRARPGNSGYAISKAALNMALSLYALENKETFVFLLGLCSVESKLSYTIGTLPIEGDFKEIRDLRERAKSEKYLVTPTQRSLDILSIIKNKDNLGITSGKFYEVRELLKSNPTQL